MLQRDDRIEASLWRRARDEGDIRARADLFERYQPLALKIAAGEFARRRDMGVELAEIRQLALEGLLQALDRFDHRREVPFAGFARPRIRGSVMDGLAKSSESAAQYRFRQRTERDRLQSLAPDRGGEEQSALAALGQLASLLAVGLMLEEGGRIDPDRTASVEPGAYDTLAWAQMQAHLAGQLDMLEEQERFVIRQHYLEDVRFSQIAEAMKLSRGRISQIHKAALRRLQSSLQRFR